MSEESKPIAPVGASPVSFPKDEHWRCSCGHFVLKGEGHLCQAIRQADFYERLVVATEDIAASLCRCNAGDAALAALKAELESCRSRLSTAEKDRASVEAALVRRLDAAEKARDEAEACVEQLVGDVQAVSRDYTDALNALRALVDSLNDEGHGEVCSSYSMMQHDPAKCDCFKQHMGAARAVLYGSDTEDAPKAPKASEIASDSSALEKAETWARKEAELAEEHLHALEKALGALRAARDELDAATIALCAHSQPMVPRTVIEQWLSPIRRTLSGGAHVDALKAQKDQADQANPEPR